MVVMGWFVLVGKHHCKLLTGCSGEHHMMIYGALYVELFAYSKWEKKIKIINSAKSSCDNLEQ